MPARKRTRGAMRPAAPRPRGRRVTRNQSGPNNMNSGRLEATQANLVVEYRELWASAVAGNPVGGSSPPALVFNPGNSGLPQLDALANLYESYRILKKVTVEYRTSSGSVNNGTFIMGCDYDARDITLGYTGVAALVPKAVGPITQNSVLHVDHKRCMNKNWLFSNSPQAPGEPAFALVYSTTSDSALGSPGDIWCQYRVEFISPKTFSVPVSSNTTQILADGNAYDTSGELSVGNIKYKSFMAINGGSTNTNVRPLLDINGVFDPGYYVVGATASTGGTGGTITMPDFLAPGFRVVQSIHEAANTALYLIEYVGPTIVNTAFALMGWTIPKVAVSALAWSITIAKTLRKTLASQSGALLMEVSPSFNATVARALTPHASVLTVSSGDNRNGTVTAPLADDSPAHSAVLEADASTLHEMTTQLLAGPGLP